MKKHSLPLLIIIFLLFLRPVQAEVALPALTGRVIDLTATLQPSEIQILSSQLENLESEKGSQLAILILPSTAPEEIEQFGIRLADFWRLGRSGVDDGLILIIAKEDRKMRIEVGRGLEGAIPDAIAKRIIEEQLVPHFRQGNFYAGIVAAVTALSSAVRGEPLPAPQKGSDAVPDFSASILFGILGMTFAKFLQGNGIARGRASLIGGVIVLVVVFLITYSLVWAFFMAFCAALISYAADDAPYYSGRSGGSSSWGGSFGGGSFGGGGGSFGGGGASGRW